MSKETLVDQLRRATREEKVVVEFADGRNVEGAILFNENKGVGKVINVAAEISVDFRLEQLSSIMI